MTRSVNLWPAHRQDPPPGFLTYTNPNKHTNFCLLNKSEFYIASDTIINFIIYNDCLKSNIVSVNVEHKLYITKKYQNTTKKKVLKVQQKWPANKAIRLEMINNERVSLTTQWIDNVQYTHMR